MAGHERIVELVTSHRDGLGTGSNVSRATSPGAGWGSNGSVDKENGLEKVAGRSRPRTYPYHKYLPYPHEEVPKVQQNLKECIEALYIAVTAGDFSPGAVHWTREIRGWLSLKFDLSTEQRVKLVKLYYELTLAPGMDFALSERFASMFMVLTKRKHYLRPNRDLTLDWRPLYNELKSFVLPHESLSLDKGSMRRNVKTLTKLCTFAQLYFDPREIHAQLEEFLPYFSTSNPETGFVVIGLLDLLFPTYPGPSDDKSLMPSQYLPTLFHLWSLINRSKLMDVHFIDLFSRLARDSLPAEHIAFTEYGIFSKEQSATIFTALLRVLEIPVGQATSAYSAHVDISANIALLLERDHRKHPLTHSVARWIVMSLSPKCLDAKDSVLSNLEGLIQAIETFFHPSNSGSWTKTLAELVYYLTDFFVMRYHREKKGEMDVPPDRRLNDEIKRRFVICLREVIFMGIFAKSNTAMTFSLATLQGLAYLEPTLILPGALQRIYPAMRGQVEVHRTSSSIRALQMLAKTMARTKGYRCHLTTLLALALPGIDPNDLDKTLHALAFMQSVCYVIPLWDLTDRPRPQNVGTANDDNMDFTFDASESDDENLAYDVTSFASSEFDSDNGNGGLHGTALAVDWITAQVDRFEREGVNITIDYENELSDAEEEQILRSSTAGLADFVTTFLGRVFTLLDNLPDAARVKSGSPEESIINTLPATITPLLASLSPKLYSLALQKFSSWVTTHVISQARDAVAFICNAFAKSRPRAALRRLIPDLCTSIRTEIVENRAGSTRTTGTEILPRDRALVWNISMLSMCVVHVGKEVVNHKEELLEIAEFMQTRCKGIPTVHVSNFMHHLLLSLTGIYTVDYSLFEKHDLRRGVGPAEWGKFPDPQELNINWHFPEEPQQAFADELFTTQAKRAMSLLADLTSEKSPIPREGSGRDWSDEVSRNLTVLRLLLSGISVFFDTHHESVTPYDFNSWVDDSWTIVDVEEKKNDNEDEQLWPTFHYRVGYENIRHSNPERFKRLHELRRDAGETLHRVHDYLTTHQEDDVQCFSALYSAYRSWFIDVGIERSAHVLDRVTRLLESDVHPFKSSGLRKEYPRPLLIRRANVYHLQRLRYNASPRIASDLDKILLHDLAQSSVSLYTEIRRTAQSAGESALKCIIGARTLIIPSLLEAFETAVKKTDYPRIKGALYSLLYGSLAKTIGRDWRFTPTLIKCFIEVSGADKPSVQKLAQNATWSVMDMARPQERLCILDREIVDELISLTPKPDKEWWASEAATKVISLRSDKVKNKRQGRENMKSGLTEELLKTVQGAHWRKATRTAAILASLDLRFETVASDGTIDLVTKGTIDQHPSLRSFYGNTFIAIFSLVQLRAFVKHSYENYLLDKQFVPDKIDITTNPDDPNWTQQYLESFTKPEAEYYIDQDYPGWLVWKKTMKGYETNPTPLPYNELDLRVRKRIGAMLDRHWFSTYFGYLKQEPRDTNADRFRVTQAMILTSAFDLVFDDLCPAKFDDIKDLTQSVYGDGTDKHQHRATAEIIGALITLSADRDTERRTEIWEWVFPRVKDIMQDGLTPENESYWNMFTQLVLGGKDPRRNWPLVDWLADVRLDEGSHQAFKESSKIRLLQVCVMIHGWHFQFDKPIVEDFVKHINHPYKSVREAMGLTLASISKTRHHESFPSVPSFVQAQKDSSSLGVRPYQPSAEFIATIKDVFARIEEWRKERVPGQQEQSSYTSGSKAVLIWLEHMLNSHDCTQLIPLFPDVFLEPLLQMMDIREDPELQSLAYHVFRHLPNVPHREGEDDGLINALVRIGRTSNSWHQRLRILINIQVIYFRRLFLMGEKHQSELFDCVSSMLADPQLEVRLGANASLSGMIRCLPEPARSQRVNELKKEYTELLVKNPLPKRQPGSKQPANGTDHNERVLKRHAAVLGLGSLVQAFPYTSPPPSWLPEILTTLAIKASADPGMVGQSVKSILADFKKTRQDTWHVDVKAFEPEQLEDLEGVLWKSYFA